MLVDCGAVLIDADAISRATTATGGAAIALIASQFGPQAIAADGAMNRDFMRQQVFDNPALKQQLETIIHPLVGLETARQTELADLAGKACIVFDIPLLVESGHWRSKLDLVLVIDCSEATQISRVTARNGWTPDATQKVLAAQASRIARRAAADICIHNDGLSLRALGLLVRQISPRFGL
jgi:dephospho-CoA kinase